MNIINNILKKKTFWFSVAVIAFAVGIVMVNGRTNQLNKQQYQFPLTKEDIESVLAGQGIDMFIEDFSTIDETTHGPSFKDIIISNANLKNDDNITFGISSQVRDNHKILDLIWYLPKTLPNALSMDQVDNFFHNELPNQFKLAGIFYGNKKELDKELGKLLDYYLDEKNYNNGAFWSKRIGNDHLRVGITNHTMSIISLMIIPDEIYEDYLITSNEMLKESAENKNIKIYNSTVAEMLEDAKKDIPPENELDTFSKHFVVNGQLKNIKENKNVPEQLANINSIYLMPNKDKYLSAKLVDDTGSVDVFLQMTSLNTDQLSMERYHNVVVLYNNNEPVYVVRLSTI